MPQPVNMTPRYLFVGGLWMLMMAMLYLLAKEPALDDGIIAVALAMTIGAIIMSVTVLRGVVRPPLIEQHEAAVRKRKNEQSRDVDPMDLLTDEDVAELRAELKDRLRLKMLEGDGEALTSFEALLTDRSRQKRR